MSSDSSKSRRSFPLRSSDKKPIQNKQGHQKRKQPDHAASIALIDHRHGAGDESVGDYNRDDYNTKSDEPRRGSLPGKRQEHKHHK